MVNQTPWHTVALGRRMRSTEPQFDTEARPRASCSRIRVFLGRDMDNRLKESRRSVAASVKLGARSGLGQRSKTRPVAAASLFGRLAPTPVGKVAAAPLALTLIVITTFLPEELSFDVFGLRLTVTRLIFLVLTPVLAVRLGQKMGAGRYRFLLSDLLVVVTGIWMILAPANIDGIGPALNHAGPLVLEFCISYFAMRILLSEHGQALSLATLLCRVIAVVALLGLLDPLTNQYFVRSLASELTGIVKGSTWLLAEDSHRLGLLRSSSTIEHPILFSAVCGVGLLIAASIPFRGRAFVIGSCVLGAIFAFSSAPIQSIFLGFALIGYGRMMGNTPFRWLALVAIGALGVAAAFVASNSPLGFIISHMTFDPSSGYYRMWTWASVSNAVGLSPWYGLGFGPYPEVLDINHSVDSLWLVAAILFGVPGAILIALAMIGSVSVRTRGPRIALTDAESTLGTTLGIVIVVLMFLSFTVDLWGTTWILAGLLMGMRAHLGELGRLGFAAPRCIMTPPVAGAARADRVRPVSATSDNWRRESARLPRHGEKAERHIDGRQ